MEGRRPGGGVGWGVGVLEEKSEVECDYCKEKEERGSEG